MIRFPCGTCGKRLRVPARLAGKRGRCEVCGAINRVPLGDVPTPPGAAEERNVGAGPAPAASGVVATDHPRAIDNNRGSKVAYALGKSPAKAPKTHVEPGSQPSPAMPHADRVEPESPAAAVPAAIHESVPEPDAGPPDDPSPEAEPVVVSEDVPGATGVVADEMAQVIELGDEDDATSAPAPPGGDLPVVASAPPVVAVDVRRADGPSPFRSTADITPRETIEGTVTLPNAQFAADGRPIAVVEGADANRTVENFLDLVQRRTAVVDPSQPPHASESDEPSLRVLHVDVDVMDDVIADEIDAAATAAVLPMSPAWRPHHAEPAAPRAAYERAAVIVALIVGLILGFCLGLLASEWL